MDEQQIAREKVELEAAPKIPIQDYQPRTLGQQGRCGWCGQFAEDLVEAELGRYKGVKCCGGRHL